METCGCRSGCMHRDHPEQPAQRTCRLGYRSGRLDGLPEPGQQPRPDEVAPRAGDALRDLAAIVEGMAPPLASMARGLAVLQELEQRARVASAAGAVHAHHGERHGGEAAHRAAWASWSHLRTTSTKDDGQ